jgi:ABC-type multidrug transport system fused ATPase/permease subunit
MIWSWWGRLGSDKGFQTFSWFDVSCTYEQRVKGKDGHHKQVATKVLHCIDGHVENGQMLAVIGESRALAGPQLPWHSYPLVGLGACHTGPSGAGKTCFLDILARRKSVGKIRGECLVDGQKLDSRQFKRRTAYVTQEDVFHPTSTVKEVVMYQAHLR